MTRCGTLAPKFAVMQNASFIGRLSLGLRETDETTRLKALGLTVLPTLLARRRGDAPNQTSADLIFGSGSAKPGMTFMADPLSEGSIAFGTFILLPRQRLLLDSGKTVQLERLPIRLSVA